MDLYSKQMVDEAKEVADRAQRNSTRQENALMTLQARVEKLSFISRALWTFVREMGGKTEQELMERVTQLQREEAEKAQKGAAAPRLCSKCNRPVAAGQERCLFCGTEVTPGSIFDRV
jgi:predicted RNase H-like nuclease (RuvC/YqgF family)